MNASPSGAPDSPSLTVAAISDGRSFSLESVQITELVATSDLRVELLCFEAGQGIEERSLGGGVVYRVVEGEAIVRSPALDKGGRMRLGKGRLLAVPAGTPHRIENAGGGLLVVSATVAGAR